MNYFLFLLCAISGTIASNTLGRKDNYYPWFSTIQFNQTMIAEAYHWMQNIKSAIPLSSLTIPGTHDTCTDDFKHKTPVNRMIIEKFTQTQSWPLSDQLKAGIRYLDIRVATDGNIYHGTYQTMSTFKGVFETVSSFLTHNPSEGIIMRIKMSIKKKCKSAECIKTNIIKVLDQYRSILFLGKRIPLLGEIRGRIFLITDKFEYENAMTWGSPLMALQDKYKMIGELRHEIKKKTKAIFEYLIKGRAKKEFIINHCSGAGAPFITIKTIAEKTNKVPYDQSGYSGIIAMDYPGEGIIQHLINQNKEFELSSHSINKNTDNNDTTVNHLNLLFIN